MVRVESGITALYIWPCGNHRRRLHKFRDSSPLRLLQHLSGWHSILSSPLRLTSTEASNGGGVAFLVIFIIAVIAGHSKRRLRVPYSQAYL